VGETRPRATTVGTAEVRMEHTAARHRFVNGAGKSAEEEEGGGAVVMREESARRDKYRAMESRILSVL
jgi:hypothetical protein